MDENISIHRNSLFIRTMDLIEQATLLASMGCDNESCATCPFFNEMEDGETCILRKIKNLANDAYNNLLPPSSARNLHPLISVLSPALSI